MKLADLLALTGDAATQHDGECYYVAARTVLDRRYWNLSDYRVSSALAAESLWLVPVRPQLSADDLAAVRSAIAPTAQAVRK